MIAGYVREADRWAKSGLKGWGSEGGNTLAMTAPAGLAV
jgi:hypothetical protein